MEREHFIESLNEHLQTEFQSVVQYVQHTATIRGPEYLSTVDELKVHLGQELQHPQNPLGADRFPWRLTYDQSPRCPRVDEQHRGLASRPAARGGPTWTLP